jgi:hypothetical protein
MQPLSVTPVEPHGQARLTFYPPSLWRTGGQACREPPVRMTCGTDKAFHLLPQGMLGNFCTKVPVHGGPVRHQCGGLDPKFTSQSSVDF